MEEPLSPFFFAKADVVNSIDTAKRIAAANDAELTLGFIFRTSRSVLVVEYTAGRLPQPFTKITFLKG